MSDFDKEAERKRLREQYEKEQQRREATEQMSDLLLKGATMTNAHCDNCGDPIFRYEGTEFCPTCQQAVGEAEDGADEATDGQSADAADTAQATDDGAAGTAANGAETAQSEAQEGLDRMADVDASDDHIEVKRPSGPAATTADRAEELAESAQAGETADQSAAGQSGQQPAQSTDHRASHQSGQPTAPPTGQSPAQTAPTGGQGAASIGAARESLVRTLASQARQAEAADDPRQAKAHLEAAREAAETLAALSS